MKLDIHESIQSYYSDAITNATACCTEGSSVDCCKSGYDPALLDSIPEELTAESFGCGDPVTIAGLKPGETVLDLGSGAGMDCFLASSRVGASGKVIGVDMTPAMLEQANKNKEKLGRDNVEFRQGFIEQLPVDDNSVDVIMSNCVINLSPDKAAVFQEAFRVLKPGGRISVSDIVTEGQISQALRSDPTLWSACVSGAVEAGAYTALIREAGFTSIEVIDKADAGFIGPTRLFSARITAAKPQ